MRIFIKDTSPYVRRTMITAHEKNLLARIEIVPVEPWEDPADLHKASPIGRLPTLLLDDGRTMVESMVIMQYFDSIGDGPKLGGVEALRRAGINQGIIDSTYAIAIEGRRPEGTQWAELVERQTRVIERTVKAAEVTDAFDLGDITLAAALGYLNFRTPDIHWESWRPDLAEWMAVQSERPSVKLTVPGKL